MIVGYLRASSHGFLPFVLYNFKDFVCTMVFRIAQKDFLRYVPDFYW